MVYGEPFSGGTTTAADMSVCEMHPDSPISAPASSGPLSFQQWWDEESEQNGLRRIFLENGSQVSIPKWVQDFRTLWRSIVSDQVRHSSTVSGGTLVPSSSEWMEEISWGRGENLLRAGDGMLWRGPNRVEIGTLVLTDRRFFFLANTRGKAKMRISLPTDKISRVEGEDIDPGQLVLRTGNEIKVFTPEGGRQFVRSFWTLKDVREEERAAIAFHANQPISGILGEAPFLQITHGGDVLAHLKGVQVFPVKPFGTELGLIYPKIPDKVLSPGNIVKIEVGQWDGVYVFDAEISRVTRAPQKVAEKVGPGHFLVVFKRPLQISRYNRRNAFRVVLSEVREAAFSRIVDEDTNQNEERDGTCSVIDMSTTGCAIRTEETLQVGDSLYLDVPLFDGGVKTIEVEIRNSVPPKGEGQTWRYGLLFHGLSKEEKREMLSEVMRSQRDLLRYVADRRVDF